jgi:pimeloyl-ACP methyl ester carboxylesterase
MPEELQLRIYGDPSLPTLVYLPGLHGDWTLIGGFRSVVAGRARFVEFTYPRTVAWSLDDYAAAIENALAQNGITGGWLLGESYGSQILWALVARGRFQAQGAILAGGFVKHPLRWAVRLAEKLTGRISDAMVVRLIFAYARIARFRYRRSPETLANLNEFIARRTHADRLAAQHRLRLIAENDPGPAAGRTTLPVFGLTGLSDPIVPWPWVRRWLGKNCPALRDYKIIWGADHNVLSTAPRQAVNQVLEWMALIGQESSSRRRIPGIDSRRPQTGPVMDCLVGNTGSPSAA